jgi:hypothetical protein
MMHGQQNVKLLALFHESLPWAITELVEVSYPRIKIEEHYLTCI